MTEMSNLRLGSRRSFAGVVVVAVSVGVGVAMGSGVTCSAGVAGATAATSSGLSPF